MSRRLLYATVATAAILVGVPALAHAATAAPVLCSDNQHAIVQDPNSPIQYQIRNPYWGAQGEACIAGTGGAGFRVIRTPIPNGRVTAYPDIFRGCIWSICSPNSKMPMQVSHISHLSSTWHTRQATLAGTVVPGRWNAAYDIWFGRRPMTTGRANGAELMIWLSHRGGCCFLANNARRVRVDGIDFILTHWWSYDRKWHTSWRYIQFRMVHPRWKVDDLPMRPFINVCERRGLIQPSWWMETFQAGFEIWSGGRGLATTDFGVTVR